MRRFLAGGFGQASDGGVLADGSSLVTEQSKAGVSNESDLATGDATPRDNEGRA